MKVASGGTKAASIIQPEFWAVEFPLSTGATPLGMRLRAGWIGAADPSGPGADFWNAAAGAPGQVLCPLLGVIANRNTTLLNAAVGRNSIFEIPIGIVGASIPQTNRAFYRHTYRCVAYRESLPVNTPCAIGLMGQNLAQFSGAVAGFQLFSINTINAGRWTVRHKLTTGGAIVQGADTGIVPTNNPQAMEFIFIEGLIPSVQIKIGGVSVFTLAGAANLPAPVVNVTYSPTFISGDAVTTAGAVDWLALSEYLVERL